MQNFMETLTSKSKNAKLPEKFNFFGKLIGSWNINYVDNSTSKVMKGEWHFSLAGCYRDRGRRVACQI